MSMSLPQPEEAAEQEVDEAPISIHRRHKREEVDMDITPMIDMTFLLLIFFLVASRMDQPASVDLPPARHGDPVAAKNAVVLIIQGSGDRATVADANGEPFRAGDLQEQERLIAAYVEAGLAGAPPFDAPKEHVLIKAEGKVEHGVVARVARAVSQGSSGQQLHIGVLEK